MFEDTILAPLLRRGAGPAAREAGGPPSEPAGRQPGSEKYEVERVATHERMLEIRDEWENLYAASRGGNPFQDPAWLTAWATAHVPAGDLWLITVRQAGRLVGVAPFYATRLGRGRASARVLQLLGRHLRDPLTETPTPLAHPDDPRGIVRAAIQYLVAHSSAHWVDVTLGDDVPWLEPQWFRGDGPVGQVSVVPKMPRPVVTLPLPTSVDALVLKRNVKESVRRARNRLKRSGMAWAVRAVSAPDEIEAAFEVLCRLHSERAVLAGRKEHRNTLTNPKTTRFLRRALTDMSRRGRAVIYLLELDGQPIAAQLVLLSPTSTYLLLSGLNEDAWQYSPMALLIHTAALDGIERGASTLRLSVGPDEAKLRWSERIDYYPQFVLVPRRPVARAAATIYGSLAELGRFHEFQARERRAPDA